MMKYKSQGNTCFYADIKNFSVIRDSTVWRLLLKNFQINDRFDCAEQNSDLWIACGLLIRFRDFTHFCDSVISSGNIYVFFKSCREGKRNCFNLCLCFLESLDER